MSENLQRALEGKPYEPMSFEQFMEAMATGASYVAEAGYCEELVRLARLGALVERMPYGSKLLRYKFGGKWCMIITGAKIPGWTGDTPEEALSAALNETSYLL